MRRFLDSLFAPSRRDKADIQKINALRAGFAGLSDDQLRAAGARAGTTHKKDLLTVIAVTAAVASRVLGLDMFDVQLARRAGAGARQHRRDADRRRQDAGGRPGHRLVRASGQRRPRHDRERLPRPPRRSLDGRDLSLPRPDRRPRSAGHDRRGAPRGLRLRYHLRHRQRDRVRFSARPPGASPGGSGPSAVRRRRDRRGRFHPDRRGSHPAGDRRRRQRRKALGPTRRTRWSATSAFRCIARWTWEAAMSRSPTSESPP